MFVSLSLEDLLSDSSRLFYSSCRFGFVCWVIDRFCDSILIREVWNDNLEEEFARIREIVDDFPYIAMDTEFPGIVLRPMNRGIYQLVARISFAFGSLTSSGIDFKKNNENGIDAVRFGELLMSSGIVLNDNVYWVTFHSGYDFGYLLKLLTCQNLPDTQAGFFNWINMYFPTLYDIKHLMKFCNSLHGGLNKLAELLEVERVGISHQAGSDSLLTACTFRKLKENFFSGSLEKVRCCAGFFLDNFWEHPSVFHQLVSQKSACMFGGYGYVEGTGFNFYNVLTSNGNIFQQQPFTKTHKQQVRLHLQSKEILKSSTKPEKCQGAKVIEKHAAQLCVLAEDCNQPDYIKLVKALCADHGVGLLTVPSAKTLGEWAGLCKIDSEGNARKVVGCSCVVVKDYGETSEGYNVVQEHVKAH
ncbi:hypothetical protein OIU84_023662 [Salix udensis]|uniref:40S ribosomal protein S12 n=1 Tax=Salix udensis TaxID=889485 RepID=A0AAD6KRD2_9ROSI|nr:hypothetical protein OIU84_023662 [Salix udensis]